MFSSAPMRLRSALPVFGIGFGLSGFWMLLAESLRPKPIGLPFDRNGTEAAAARRARAVLGTEIGVIRGRSSLVRGTARTALGAFSKCRISPRVALDLAPWRRERAATASALADKDLPAFSESDNRAILDRGPEIYQATIAAIRNAWPRNLAIFESLVADADPAVAQLLRSVPPIPR